MNNAYNDPQYRDMIDNLKVRLERLKKEVKDDDQFADAPPKDEPGPRRPKP
jgi:hypothetical protein